MLSLLVTCLYTHAFLYNIVVRRFSGELAGLDSREPRSRFFSETLIHIHSTLFYLLLCSTTVRIYWHIPWLYRNLAGYTRYTHRKQSRTLSHAKTFVRIILCPQTLRHKLTRRHPHIYEFYLIPENSRLWKLNCSRQTLPSTLRFQFVSQFFNFPFKSITFCIPRWARF